MNVNVKQNNNHNSETEILDNYKIKDCFVRVQKIDKQTIIMETETPVVRKRGRPSKAAKEGTSPSVSVQTSTPKPKSSLDKLPAKTIPLKKRVANTPNLIIETTDGGRSRRTPKPNPRYMNDDTVVVTKQLIKDDSMSDEDDDDDVRRTDGSVEKSINEDGTPTGTGKRRGRPPKIKKHGPFKIKSAESTPVTSVRKILTSSTVPGKRKIAETDIDVDDDRAKQLFLDAKRRLTQSPQSDEEYSAPSGGKSTDSSGDGTSPSALAAKLRAKFSNDIPLPKKAPGRPSNNNRTIRISPKFMNKGKDKSKSISTRNSNSGKEQSKDQEDFEQMPTFTIVNINDIMNQKNEDAVLVRKRKAEPINAKRNDTESSDDEGRKDSSDNESQPKSQNAYNRRKTLHTKILSDDKLAKNATNAKVAKLSSNNKSSPLVKHGHTKAPLTGSNNNGRFKHATNKPAILRSGPPPRILNSSLCKPGASPALVTKLITTNDEKSNKQNNNTITAYGRSKENNVMSYTYTEKDGKLVPKKPIISPVKSTNSPVIRRADLSRTVPRPIPLPPYGADRRVKKITCFETWHVLKSPESKRVIYKSILTVNLLHLGNNIRDIQLPSSDWSYKIILQQAPKRINKPVKDVDGKNVADGTADSTNEPDIEVYTGEIQGQNISEEDKHLYIPGNILFRRKCNTNQDKNFDRTVILRNRTFLINIEAKNIRLVTAPQYIQSFSDIEILLQIVNDVGLDSADVDILG